MKTSQIYRFALSCMPVMAIVVFGNLSIAQDTKPNSPIADAQEESKSTAGDQEADKTANESVTEEPLTISVADEKIQFTATGNWKSIPPRSQMIEAEIKVSKVGTDEEDGRLTIMGAGGSIEANIDRWKEQFTQPDGGSTSDKTKTEKKTVADQTVHMVDISGTFLDSPGGPFAGGAKVERANYRMIAAIVETKDLGNYFVKFYGPKATVDKNAEAFKAMIESMKLVD